MTKKLPMLVILFFLMMPLMVDASEECTVVSGNGVDLGSEIACGSEHFYILSRDDNETRMLAKYNLYTGYMIERVKIEREPGDTSTAYEYCSNLARERGVSLKVDIPDSEFQFYTSEEYCYLESKIDDSKMVQKEEAKSAHWEKDSNGEYVYLYPQVGDNYMHNAYYGGYVSDGYTSEDAHTSDNSVVYDAPGYKDFVITLDNTTMTGDKLAKYKASLAEMGFEIKNIDMLSVNEIDNIIYKTANKRLPLKDWGDGVRAISTGGTNYNTSAVFGDLKPYIPEEYSWLYSTTYWNKTIFYSDNTFGGNSPGYYNLFVAQQGKLCGAGYQYCAPATKLGCGIRPVITVSNEVVASVVQVEESEEEPKDEPKEEPKEKQKNPETKDIILVVSVLLILSLIGVLYFDNKVKKGII